MINKLFLMIYFKFFGFVVFSFFVCLNDNVDFIFMLVLNYLKFVLFVFLDLNFNFIFKKLINYIKIGVVLNKCFL